MLRRDGSCDNSKQRAAVMTQYIGQTRLPQKKRAAVITQKKRAAVITQKKRAAVITQKKRAAEIAQKRGQP